MRRQSKQVFAGKVAIGGGAPISVQSMLNVPASDIEGNVRQAVELERAGCEILRVSIPDQAAVALIPAIKQAVQIPLVADIHFDYRLALESAAAGIDKIRINPGNIGRSDHVKAVADACRQRGIPIRIGVNSCLLYTSTQRSIGENRNEELFFNRGSGKGSPYNERNAAAL